MSGYISIASIGGVAEVSDLIGRSKQIIYVWEQRGTHGVPRPLVTLKCGPIYDMHAWREWAARNPHLLGEKSTVAGDSPTLESRTKALMVLACGEAGLYPEDLATLLRALVHPGWADPSPLFKQIIQASEEHVCHPTDVNRTTVVALAWSLVLAPEPDGPHIIEGADG